MFAPRTRGRGADRLTPTRVYTNPPISNLHCLCTKHHNAKTTGAWDVTINPDGEETWTSFGDGHTVITTPNGPLGRITFRHRAVKRARKVVEHNQRKQKRNQEDEPPF